ncbi:MAG: glutamate-5-semialdehyde dehydrogenase [Alphaproteobacteria bacterium]|nr:glutamate-5-semialdehyde dehydrogenase [Alphaproteobacteria bacterium]
MTHATLENLAEQARAAQIILACQNGAARRHGLLSMADALMDAQDTIMAANHADLAAAKDSNLSDASMDRMSLSPARILGMINGVRAIADQPDPLGQITEQWTRPNGLKFSRITVPIGTIGMIFESRPNVAAEAGAIAVLSGNAIILRGGSECFRSNAAIISALRQGLAAASLPANVIQMVPTADRAWVSHMLKLVGLIDLIIPRGGQSLIRLVQQESRLPVLAHLDGNCHVYVHGSAKIDQAVSVVVNAKMRRVGVCGAAESLVFDDISAKTHMKEIVNSLLDAGCAVRGDARVQTCDGRVTAASEDDWRAEYLAPIISACVVDDAAAAIAHINKYGSHHTDAILAEDEAAIAAFYAQIDSAIVLANASTQFADGGEFGFGGEIGIATGKFHARGPVGAAQLTSYKYVLRGRGQIRPV